MTHDIDRRIVRVALPIWPDDSSSTVNLYILQCSDGYRAIDCGPPHPYARDRFLNELASRGIALSAIEEILVTHSHPDHVGLVPYLIESGARRVLVHPEEAASLTGSVRATSIATAFADYLERCGVPQRERDSFMAIVQRIAERQSALPEACIAPIVDGTVLDWPPFRFRVFVLPGHAPGLLVLYDEEHGMLFSSDHVLRDTSPHVGFFPGSADDPLGDYLAGLHRLRKLSARLTYPGHGKPFDDLAQTIDRLVLHHQERLTEILQIAKRAPATPYEIATHLTWAGRPDMWEQLSSFDRWLALTETMAHLRYLVRRGRVRQLASEPRWIFQV